MVLWSNLKLSTVVPEEIRYPHKKITEILSLCSGIIVILRAKIKKSHEHIHS